MKNELTIKEQFAMVKTALENAGEDKLADFIQGRIDLLNKKSESKKPKETSEEDKVLTNEVVNAMTTEGATVSDILKNVVTANADRLGTSTQKVTALLKVLVAEGKVVKDDSGKKTLYALVDAE